MRDRQPLNVTDPLGLARTGCVPLEIGSAGLAGLHYSLERKPASWRFGQGRMTDVATAPRGRARALRQQRSLTRQKSMGRPLKSFMNGCGRWTTDASVSSSAHRERTG